MRQSQKNLLPIGQAKRFDFMTDKEFLTASYNEMYRCMIEKDVQGLEKLLDDTFILIHMTGRKQNKTEYLQHIRDGILNYYSAEHDNIIVNINGNTAILRGQSRVAAAVFGGGRSMWNLQLDIEYVNKNNKWLQTRVAASTYGSF